MCGNAGVNAGPAPAAGGDTALQSDDPAPGPGLT